MSRSIEQSKPSPASPPAAAGRSKKAAAPNQSTPRSPWDELDADGASLSVEDFLTTVVSLASNALRRTITLPYAQQFGLTMPEWRIISVLAHAGQLPFTELVVRSATDKGQLSRTLRTLQSRQLVAIRSQSDGSKKLDCMITRKGRALYEQVMPVARREQASMIRKLDPNERRVLYGAMKKLTELCGPGDDGGEE